MNRVFSDRKSCVPDSPPGWKIMLFLPENNEISRHPFCRSLPVGSRPSRTLMHEQKLLFNIV